MVLTILTISLVSIASYIVMTSVLRDALRVGREEMKSGAGRHRFVAAAANEEDGGKWRHANNNRPLSLQG